MESQIIKKPYRINALLVDNNISFSNYYTDLLTTQFNPPFSISRTANLRDALRSLKESKPDIVLLSLDLPDSTGVETYRHIKKCSKDIPHVILGDAQTNNDAIKAVQQGANSLIDKSETDPRHIICTLCRTLEHNRLQRKLDVLNCQLLDSTDKLKKLSFVDPLTDLFNRKGLQNALSGILTDISGQSAGTLVVLLNIDDFRSINHSLGHAVGDVILKEISLRLKELLRLTDYISRIGEDEFLILLSETTMSSGKRIAEKIRLSISGSPLVLTSGNAIQITACLGIAALPKDISSVDELLAVMHPLLNKSKKSGRNQVLTSEHKKKKNNRGENSTSVENFPYLQANRSFYSVKQPIVDLHSRRIKGYEFLSRTRISSFELPDHFFRLSHEQHLLPLIDRRCLSICLADSSGLNEGQKIHLNIFPSTIIDIPPQHILDLFPPQRTPGTFCIEISEQQIIGDPSNLIEAISIFKKGGIQIAIDDVGFGHSSLENLILLEPDIVKIDKKYVIGIADNPSKCLLLKRLLKVTSSLDTEVIAEGIENTQDLETLKNLGVQYGQGYLLGYPE